MSKRDVCVETAAKAGGLNTADLERAMDDPQTAARIKASSDAFAAFNVPVRPTFVVRSPIGDAYVLSGCWRYELLAQVIREALSDADVYEKFMRENKAPAGVV
jgi:predicted DsbA family dithiol-disulfide isomerase